MDVDIDNGLAISSFLLAHFSMILGDHTTAKKHLQGMSIVLGKLGHTEGPPEESVPSPLTTDKLTMLIWQMAIRIDFISSIACGKEPVLPKLVRLKDTLILVVSRMNKKEFIINGFSPMQTKIFPPTTQIGQRHGWR